MLSISKIFKIIFKILIYLFAIWGFLLSFVYFAQIKGWTKSKSRIDKQASFFKNLKNEKTNLKNEKTNSDFEEIKNLEEWKTIKQGILKDKILIDEVSQKLNLEKRLLITPLIVEQLRLLTSEREIFKRYFQPVAILGTQTQFSLGLFGIKDGTAEQIENNLKNKNSQFYLGENYENILDYTEIEKENLSDSRFKRLTDEKKHYFSYLYAGLYLKQILISWEKKGFDIQNRPEIIATIFNLGFNKSDPNPNPISGGAEITLNNKKYSFGKIAYLFYYSDELKEIE